MRQSDLKGMAEFLAVLDGITEETGITLRGSIFDLNHESSMDIAWDDEVGGYVATP